MAEEQHEHDRITHMDLFNLWRGDMSAMRNEMRNDRRESKNEIHELKVEMRWMIGVGFALILLFLAFASFVR